MSAKHIPGPWKKEPQDDRSDGDAIYIFPVGGGVAICDVVSRDGEGRFSSSLQEVAEATADLIVAAPDMYAAIDAADVAFAVLNVQDLGGQARGCIREAWPLVQAARAKANPGSVYAECIAEAHSSEISRLDAVNSDLYAALETMVDYVNSLSAIPCISKAMEAVGAARSALSRSREFCAARRDRDAILAAEAPNMLGMLELALKYVDHPDVKAISFALPAECVADRMRAVIAKAKGE